MLRKESKIPEDVEIPMENVNPVTIVFDATKTREDRLLEVDNLCNIFDTSFPEVARQAYAKHLARKEARAAVDAKRALETKAKAESEINHVLAYAKALSSHDPNAKETFFKTRTPEVLSTLLQEISANPMRLNSIFNYQISYAIDLLRYETVQARAHKSIFGK